MNLPPSEQIPDDSDRLPPARRRRAGRSLAPLDGDARAQSMDRMAQNISLSFDYFLFSILAAILITAGLLFDAVPILLLGALAAPLMSPVIGMSLGTMVGSVRFFLRSLAGLVLGCLLVFGIGAFGGILFHYAEFPPLNQAHALAQLSWPNFVVLIFGILATAASLVNSDRNPVLPRLTSVALAYELYAPLAVAGFGLTSGVAHLWPDGLVVFVFHLALAALLGAFVLALFGFRPINLFGYTIGGAAALLVVIVLVGLSGAGTAITTQLALPTAVPTLTLTPTLTPTVTETPLPSATSTETPTPTLSPTITPSPTITLTPTPTPVYAMVNAETGNPPGLLLRSDPSYNAKILKPYLNGTLVVILETRNVNEDEWAYVRVVQDNLEGWMLMRWLLVATPSPTW